MYFFIFLFILSILVNIFLWQCTRFWVQLFVRSGNVQSQFSIAENFEHHDYFYNFVSSDSQLMHGSVPWRGPREKNPEFMKSFIEALSKVGDIIFEWNASTGYFLLSFFPTIFSFSNLVFHNHTHIYIYILTFDFLRQVLLFVHANLLADTFWPLRRIRRSSRLFWNPLSPPRFVLLWLRRGRLCGVAWEIVQRRS